MSEWREVELGDLVDIFDHKRVPLSSAQRATRQGPYPYYGAQGIIDHIDEFIFDGRYILVPEDGENLRSRKLPIAYFADGQFWVNNHAHIVRAKAGIANDRFVQSAIEASHIGAYITGAAQPKLSQANLRQIRLGVPSLSVQNVIAAFLDDLDDLIENNRRRVEVLEEMARAIYREWFVHFRYPGHERVAIVDSPLGLIPEGWRLSTCGDELTALGGGTPSKKEPSYWDGGTVPWFTPSDLTKSRSRFTAESELCITEEGVARSSARRFPVGSVLMTSRATLGVLAIATAEATTNQGFIVIPPDDRWAPGFIYEWLEAQADELASIATGATFKEITKGAFRRVPFLVPAQAILDAHRERIAGIEQQIHTLEQATINLVALRDLLLPKLVTGQIDVSSLDLDAVMEGSLA